MHNLEQKRSAAFHAFIADKIKTHPELNTPATIQAMRQIFNAGFTAAATLNTIDYLLSESIKESEQQDREKDQ